MSRERARRRAEREAAAAVARQARAREVARRARRRAVRRVLARPLALVATRRPRPDSALGRRRARQNGALLAALFVGNGVLWLFQPSWLLRGSALALSALAWPLLVVLVYDRGRSA